MLIAVLTHEASRRRETVETMTRRQGEMDIEEFGALIETYGGEQDRWPADRRAAMVRLMAEDGAAVRLAAEAQALDRLLDAAPAIDDERLSGLTQRIVAAARSEGRWQGDARVTGTASVGRSTASVPRDDEADGRRSTSSVGTVPRGSRAHSGWLAGVLSGPGRGPLASAGMLAASLAIGIMIGLSVTTGDLATVEPTAGAQVVADASDDGVMQQLVGGDDSLDTILEDLL